MKSMDGFISFVVSINKIALLAFIAVFTLLSYEVKKMLDEKRKKEKPVVPQFDDKMKLQPLSINGPSATSNIPVKRSEKEGNAYLLIVIGIISLIGVLVLIIVTYNTQLKKQKVDSTPIPIIREISSDGLKVYNMHWVEIENKKENKAKPGEKLYIGIQTIVEADIDRARIKINTRDWTISDITTLFNSQKKVYYREYIVATGTAQLKIDAQLHSASDGWLGE